MLVRIVTDISYSLAKKAAWFAFTINFDGFEYKRSGQLRDYYDSSSETEGACILNAVWFYQNKIKPCMSYVPENTILVTDSMVAIDCLDGGCDKKSKYSTLGPHLKAMMREANLCEAFKNEIIMFHVKGHNPKPETNDEIENVWCDKMAGRAKKSDCIDSVYCSNTEFNLQKFLQLSKSTKVTQESGYKVKRKRNNNGTTSETETK